MKWLVPLILLISFKSDAQLSYDSLINICRHEFETDVLNGPDDELRYWLKKDQVRKDVKEIFKDVFPDVKIFSVTPYWEYSTGEYHENGPSSTYPLFKPSYYILDSHTGNPPLMQKFSSFNKELDSASYKFTNLDKCYLFIFFNHMTNRVITRPAYYKKIINTGSLFSIYNDLLYGNIILYRQDLSFDLPFFEQMNSIIFNSTKRTINIFVKDGDEVRYYIFTFTRNGDISNVSTHYFGEAKDRFILGL